MQPTLLFLQCVLWPCAARYVFFNNYRCWACLILRGCDEFLYSCEGTIQGDPLSMFLYAVATMPLILKLNNSPNWTQLWYADDSAAIVDTLS